MITNTSKLDYRSLNNLFKLKRLSSLNNDIESKELEISRLKKYRQDSENENNFLVAINEKFKYNNLI